MPGGAPERARNLDGAIERLLASLVLPASRDLIAPIRTYLLRQNADMGFKNNVHAILKTTSSRGVLSITLGPSFDKGPEQSHFYLESGSRLSFAITLRESNNGCSLVAYRFQLSLPEGCSPSFYRFDLNRDAHQIPLLESKSVNPGVREHHRRFCAGIQQYAE
jgi:hypothetical protein